MDKFVYIKNLIVIVCIILIASILASVVSRILKNTKRVDKTLKGFVNQLLKAIIYFIAFMMIGNTLGVDTSSILALASILSAAIALSAQTALSNLFGGVTMLITHPFKIDDYISSGGMEGSVYEINLFHTKLKTPDNKLIIIPNGSLSNSSIINYSNTGKRRAEIKIGVSYDCKIKKVKDSLNKAIKKTVNVLEDEPFIRVTNYLDSSIEFTVRVWARTEEYWNVYFDLMENIKEQFDKDKIEIPYNQIVVHKKTK